jgi:hypothetical protein
MQRTKTNEERIMRSPRTSETGEKYDLIRQIEGKQPLKRSKLFATAGAAVSRCIKKKNKDHIKMKKTRTKINGASRRKNRTMRRVGSDVPETRVFGSTSKFRSGSTETCNGSIPIHE